jgi:hypothetical protein
MWFAAYIVFLTMMPIAPSQAAPEGEHSELLARIQDAWTKRSTRALTGEFQWRSKEYRPKGSRIPADSPEGPEPSADIMAESSVLLVVGPNSELRYERQGTQYLSFKRSVGNLDQKIVFDGRECRTYSPRDNDANPCPSGYIQDENSASGVKHLNPVLWTLGKKTVSKLCNRAADMEVVADSVELNGTSCAILKFKNLFQLWLSRDRDFVIVRADMFNPKSGEVATRYDIEYVENNDIGFSPSSWTIHTFRDAGQIDYLVTAEVTHFELNADTNLDDFKLEFPVGTYVIDTRNSKETWFIQRSDGQKRIVLDSEIMAGYDKLLSTNTGEAIAGPKPLRSSRELTKWIIGFNAVIFAVIITLWAMRKRTRGRGAVTDRGDTGP